MNQFKKSDEFEAWFKALKDLRAKTRILARIVSAEKGNFGDTEPVGHGVSEMRIHYGRDTGSITPGKGTLCTCC
ncbi:hypothetical protein [Brucella cytisi]|uniref:type II toxin-antitoxin system RelE/ParE family toxin n=1 Tax=Brucella cytisi TaxID=407152 RepID=UPI00313ED8B0